MLVDVFKQVVSSASIQIFKNFLNSPDRYVDDRGNVYNKLMTPVDTNWPQDEVKQVLNKVIPLPYEIENIDFVRMSFISRLHTDTDDGNQTKLYKNVIIPLEEHGDASTAIFPNKWYGPKAKFTKIQIPQFEYWIKDSSGNEIYIEDMRDLLKALTTSKDFLVKYNDGKFKNSLNDRQQLENLIEKRKSIDQRVSDYNGITDITDRPFPEDFRLKYLAHIDSESLHGLGIPEIVRWQVGDVITFDRQLLHSGTSTLTSSKSFVAGFLYHA
jgi:hypothetical protein